ncbi:MAG: Wzz/FepE/Etk N-terminal domain-containing protein [Nibricoccus sp.]
MPPKPVNNASLLVTRSAQPVTRIQNEPQGTNLSLSDIYYTIFRHKWKIFFCSLLGLAGAAVFYTKTPRTFKSEAKLFVRYVTESRTPMKTDASNDRNPDPYGVTILNSEIAIITSLDLAKKVVDTLGVETFIKPTNDGFDKERAYATFCSGLLAEAPAHSTIIDISFSHQNPAIVQPVLREIIIQYLKKHVQIHRYSGLVDDLLIQEADQMRSRLAETEEALRKAKGALGYASIEEGVQITSTLTTRARQELADAETELAERLAFITNFETNSAKAPVTTDATTTAPALPPRPPENIVNSYTRLVNRLANLKKTEQDLLNQFTPENVRVKDIVGQIEDLDAEVKKLESEYPSLKLTDIPQVNAPTAAVAPSTSVRDIGLERARIRSLESKTTSLKVQLAKLKEEIARINSLEPEFTELVRRKTQQESNYLKYSNNLEQARFAESTNSGNVSNISEIQSPSFATKVKSKRIVIVPAIAVGGFVIGLAWAFLIELYVDRSLRRPSEIERKLDLPLFLSMPQITRKDRKKVSKAIVSTKSTPEDTTPAKDSLVSHALQPYFAALRDRLIGFYENQDLTHKPKLIAVTGLSRKTGVSTVAAGIAQSLSETGEGNVLLVNMNRGEDAAHQFSQGKVITHFDDVLENKHRKNSDDNLYIVSEGSNSEQLIRNLPQRFSKMLPKLKSSDFDYIIFDMPPVSQISITPRLAGYMDIVLMTVESEKTDQDQARQAATLLESANVQVGIVLNKTQSYVPKVLNKGGDLMLGR